MKLKVAITGGAGSGKSTLIRELKEALPIRSNPLLSYISMDNFTDELYKYDQGWLSWLYRTYGTNNRAEVSAKAFNNPEMLAALTRQSAFKLGYKLGSVLSTSPTKIQIVEFPLLFEAGMEHHFDEVILITANMAVRLGRVMLRGKTEQEALELLTSQMPEEDKAEKADHIINTSVGGIKNCATELIKIIRELDALDKTAD